MTIQEEGGWEYLPLTTVMEEEGFKEIGVYILKRQNTVAQYIATRPILDLCKRTVRRPGGTGGAQFNGYEGAGGGGVGKVGGGV